MKLWKIVSGKVNIEDTGAWPHFEDCSGDFIEGDDLDDVVANAKRHGIVITNVRRTYTAVYLRDGEKVGGIER